MIYYQNSCMLILFTGDMDCLTGDILCGDINYGSIMLAHYICNKTHSIRVRLFDLAPSTAHLASQDTHELATRAVLSG